MATYSKPELEAAAERVFHNITQLFGYYAWIAKIAPGLEQQMPGARGHLFFNLAQNAVVDGFLINLRRLNEFFSNRPKGKEKHNDLLRAYHFGFPEVGRFLDEDDMIELHKRIAHSTIHTALHGDASFKAFEAAELALKHSFRFLDYLSTSFYTNETPQSTTMRSASRTLTGLWTSWSQEIQAEQKNS